MSVKVSNNKDGTIKIDRKSDISKMVDEIMGAHDVDCFIVLLTDRNKGKYIRSSGTAISLAELLIDSLEGLSKEFLKKTGNDSLRESIVKYLKEEYL